MKVIAPDHIIDNPIEVPASKSISNRLLIIRSLSGSGEVGGLSEAQDTQVLNTLLEKMPSVMDVGHAGTAFRFLTAYLSIQSGTFILTGSERMKQRPIHVLVDALKKLGADIVYLERDGFPPLQITGSFIKGGVIEINARVSSQFISALMMIGPYLEKGLEILLTNKPVSKPYIDMTAQLMKACGVDVVQIKNKISIPNSTYTLSNLTIEKDWSSIAFWCELVVIGKMPNLLINDVVSHSIQGDRVVLDMFKPLGLASYFDEKGLYLQFDASEVIHVNESIDFSDCPDLSQPYVTTLAGVSKSQEVTGTVTLKNKETDRGLALKNELAQFGCKVDCFDMKLKITADNFFIPRNPVKTYEDHRMAMAFAPLVIMSRELEIENPEVVNKSYPDYWKQLEKLGFQFVK